MKRKLAFQVGRSGFAEARRLLNQARQASPLGA
jgi:hypothetical protein